MGLPTLGCMTLNRDLLRASWRSWLLNDPLRRGPYWLQLVWTLLFCFVIALGFTLLGFLSYGSGRGAWRNLPGWWHWYQINLVMSLMVGFTIHGLFELSLRLIGPRRLQGLQGWRRAAYYSGVPIVGVLVGWPLGASLVSGRSGFQFSSSNMNFIVGMLLVSVFITLLLYQFFDSKARQIQAERRATEAQLQLLQAQIEPHFLFNTLANVLSLIEHDAPRAKLMLESFTDYLRASLGELRREHSSVGAELDMASAYLQLLQLRMDERLRFRIEASEAARRVVVPPLLLQPLIENAIQHGLEPKVEGGEVIVRASVEGDRLRLVVEDNGLGLPAAGASSPVGGLVRPVQRNGLALDNIRQRLLARHGELASLALEALSPGTRATIVLPVH